MKKISLITISLLLIIFMAACGGEKEMGPFEYEPEKPSPGESLEIEYEPEETVLGKTDSVEMVVYFYSTGMPIAKSTILKKGDDDLEAEVQIPQDARGILVKFTDNGTTDNNKGKGYIIHLYGKDGKPVPGTYAGLAEALSYWGSSYLGVERNYEKSVELFRDEFENNPEIKGEYVDPYINALRQSPLDNADSLAKQELDDIKNKKNPSQEELRALVRWYNRFYDDNGRTEYMDRLKKMDPESPYALNDRIQEIAKMDPDRQIEAAKEFVDKHGPDAADRLHFAVMNSYRQSGDYERFLTYTEEVPEVSEPALMNTIAWGLVQANKKLDLAQKFAEIGIEEARNRIKNPADTKPSQETEKEYRVTMGNELAMILDTYGLILEKQGNMEQAIRAYAEAKDLTQGTIPELNERYARALIDAERYVDARQVIEDFVEKGNFTPNMEDLLKEAYAETEGSEDGWLDYYRPLLKTAHGKIRQALEDEMINKPAPEFTLTDLDGNEVKLSDLEGKIVVIDFWATWCGPCIKSMPGMINAVEKYKDDEGVKFLFVNTLERVEDKEKNARSFIEDLGYSLHVLMDTDDKVVRKYGVQGIPTKFVIGPDGNIRFKSVGFGGNIDQMVEEISVMIDMVREDNRA